MTRKLVRMLDELDPPAPVVVGMVLVGAAIAKGHLAFWAIGGMVAFYALFVVARLSLPRFRDQRAVTESAAVASCVEPSSVPLEAMKPSSLTSPVQPRDPQPSAAPQTPLQRAA